MALSFFFAPALVHPTQKLHLSSPRRRPTATAKAVKEWREYEKAVKEKDLSRALPFLQSTDGLLPLGKEELSTIPTTAEAELRFFREERDWEVLDTCLNADDMKLAGSAYWFLQQRGFLPNFGKCRNISSKLAPKKWGLSGLSGAVLIGFFGGASFLISKGIDIRTNLAVVLGLACLDAVFLGGTCLAQISSLWPPYGRRYLFTKLVSFRLAGTQFWDEKLEEELAEGKLSGAALTGIAWYSLLELQQKHSYMGKQKMANQARWSVLQSYSLLKWHKAARTAAVKALESGSSLSMVIRRIEEAIPYK